MKYYIKPSDLYYKELKNGEIKFVECFNGNTYSVFSLDKCHFYNEKFNPVWKEQDDKFCLNLSESFKEKYNNLPDEQKILYNFSNKDLFHKQLLDKEQLLKLQNSLNKNIKIKISQDIEM